MPRCDNCPVSGDSPCVGESAPIFCAWAESGDEAKVRHVVRRSAIGVEMPKVEAKPPAPPPTLLQKAANLTRAVAKHVAHGMPSTDPETLARRLATCEACDRFDRSDRTCMACGCFCDAKARWLDQTCPAGKW